MLRFFCCELERKAAVIAAGLNGIDYLEVDEAPPGAPRTTLRLYFFSGVAPGAFTTDDVRVEGGDTSSVLEVRSVDFPGANLAVVELVRSGDCGRYFLQLKRGTDNPPAGFDRILSSIDLYFWPEETGELACLPDVPVPMDSVPAPELNYLARDFLGLRTLMFDRLRSVSPSLEWGHPADLGTALVELLAAAGDRLSYAQDAVATEAYLSTARQRVSVRRHARLVGYAMHDGCNARSWVQLHVAPGTQLVRGLQDVPLLPAKTLIFGAHRELPGRIVPGSEQVRLAIDVGLVGFQTLHAVRSLEAALERASFYTWGAGDCRLPRGATRATLRGRFLGLFAGDVLIFAEAKSPRTGSSADADPTRRHAVRLTRVRASIDEAGGQLVDPPQAVAVEVTEIEWSEEDALPWSCAISKRIDEHRLERDMTVVLGNIVLADHGVPLDAEYLGEVRARPDHLELRTPGVSGCEPDRVTPPPLRFRPSLLRTPLTWAAPYVVRSASRSLHTEPKEAIAELSLEVWTRPLSAGTARPPIEPPDQRWEPRRDLIDEDAASRTFVVEIDNRATASLRFGDDRHGRRPELGSQFFARYRVGNGPDGNIGAATLASVVTDRVEITGASNPLPALGGVRPETMEEAKIRAPFAFRKNERAVTLADYAALAERFEGVQRAAATWRFTGTWKTVFLAIDRYAGLPVDAEFEAELRAFLEPYRTLGHDLEIEGPRYVQLHLAIHVCLDDLYFRAQVATSLARVFSTGFLDDGTPALFNPDRYTFGQPVLLSEIYAASHRVPGVRAVDVRRFQRLDDDASSGLETGRVEIGPFEIARFSASVRGQQSFGRFELELEGGR
jgi:hypothetical protein